MHAPDEVPTLEADPRPIPTPELRRLEGELGDLAVEGEIARTPRAAIFRVRVGRHGDRPLALKLALQPSDRDDLARFRHEARLLSEVRHPNVVEVYEVGVLAGDLPFLLMELTEPFRPEARPSAEAIFDLAIQAAAGLAHIHHHRVVHLDVKPGNLGTVADAATGGRRFKILDFGLAQALLDPVDRAIRGTLAYTAPEVLLQDRYDHRADLYSLGLTLLETATGVLPSAGDDRDAILYHLRGEAPDPRALRGDLPEELAAILSRLLRRDPRERYPSAGRLLEELARAAGRELDPGELALGTGGVLASRLVGRDAAGERLSRELAAARRGESRTLVVEGPEGVGKSRLLREFRLTAAIEGSRVVLGRASAEGGRPLQPVLQALEQLDVEVVRSGDQPHQGDARGRFRLYREIGRALAEAARRRGPAPLVLILEDLQLAGPETRELLAFLAADLESAPLLLVGSRTPDPETSGPTAADPGVLVLAPLAKEATGELVDASLGIEQPGSLPAGLYDWLHEASGGLPATLQQLLCQLIDEGDLIFRGGEWKPRRTALARLGDHRPTDGLDRRLEALDEPPRRLLEAAAVIGAPFRATVAAELLDIPVDDVWAPLTALAEQGLLEPVAEPGGSAYAVAGARLRDTLYALIDPARRTELHLRLGERLARRVEAGAGELASGAAEHLWRAGRRAEALPYLASAARGAVAIHAHADAATLFGRAAEAAEAAGDGAAAAEARAGRARALALAGHPGRALREYQKLLEEEAPSGAPGASTRARWNLEKGRLHGRIGEHAAAFAAFEAGLAAALEAARPGVSPDPELRIELLHGKAVAQRDLGRATEASETARTALREARSAGLGRQRALLVNTLAMLSFARGEWQRAGRLARWGLRGALETGDAYLAVVLRNTLAMVRWKTGDLDGASALYGDNLAAAEALNDPWAQQTALNNLGILRCGRGDWQEARPLLAKSLEMNRRMGAREGEALTRINLGEVEEVLGDWRRARRHAKRALALLEGSGDRADRVAAQLLLASLARKSGATDEAAALLESAAAGAGATGDRDLVVQALLQGGLLELDRERLDLASQGLDDALAAATESGTAELLVRVFLARAELALVRGDRQGAAREAQAARDRAQGLRDRLAEARLLAVDARLAALGEGEEAIRAERLFAQAVTAFEVVAARYEVARALYAWGLATRTEAPAAERLERALSLFAELGAEPDADRARSALARVRERRRLEGAGDASGWGAATLQELMRVLNSSLDQREVLDRAMDVALERLGAERGMIVLADPLTRELQVAAARNLGQGDEDEGRKLSESVVRRVIERNEPVVAVDALTDSRFAGAESIVASHILSILCVPLTIRDRLAGAIYVDHCRSRHLFGKDDLEFLRAFGDVSAVAIENARLFGELQAARQRLEEENRSLRREIFAAHHLGSLIGKSRAIEELKATLGRVAQSSSTVLIRGESGTGKGLVARIIHNVSPRREGPFVHFNCAALPETLVESELFGHEKGAFTGAIDRKPGRFELAHEGTIFLDEIGKVSRSIQAKLLRVVEDKEFERVGGTRTQRSDVRIIAATNLDLEDAITRGEFREDLYYRLNIIPIVLPPLRERREDLPYLVRHFVDRIGRDLGQAPRELDPAVLEVFARHPWPGNVRELESAIHRALVLSQREVLGPDDFAWISAEAGAPVAGGVATAGAPPATLGEGDYEAATEALDRQLVELALAQSDGRIRETARLLGIARNTLRAKMTKYGLGG